MSRRSTTGGLSVVVAGMIAATPAQGGATWAVLQYLLGLRRLGHRVHFVEELPASSLRPADAPLDRTFNARYAAAVLDGNGLRGRWALVQAGTRSTAGLPHREVVALARGADVLINLAGTLRDPEITRSIPTRVYVDLDPGFTQVWHDAHGIDMGLDGHTHFASVGAAVGRSDCPVPPCGRSWIATAPPVVLEKWPYRPYPEGPVTTVANWRSYGSVHVEGLLWGQKAHSWRPLIDLPSRSGECFEVALAIADGDAGDLQALRANRWRLQDPASVAPSPSTYRRFIRASKAELCVAKSGYVHSRSGWVSDRSVCYLASGRPVAAQDTGATVAGDAGLVAFATVEEAAEVLAAFDRDYALHSRAARSLAEEVFDSDKVLSGLLAAVRA